MQLGVIFPQTEIGADPTAVRDFVQAAEGMGYEHVIVFDHVLGADTAHYQGWQGPYTHHDMFHEPFVLYGYLAAVTQRIELVTAVVEAQMRVQKATRCEDSQTDGDNGTPIEVLLQQRHEGDDQKLRQAGPGQHQAGLLGIVALNSV